MVFFFCFFFFFFLISHGCPPVNRIESKIFSWKHWLLTALRYIIIIIIHRLRSRRPQGFSMHDDHQQVQQSTVASQVWYHGGRGFRFLSKACTSIIHWLLETCGSWLVQGMSHGFIGCQIRGYGWEWAITDQNRSGHPPVLKKIQCRLWRLDNDQATAMPIDEWGFWHSSDNTHWKITRSDHFLSLKVR